MIPPTPTYMPQGTPIPVDLDGLSLWDMSPKVVGLWGQFHDYTPVLQWVIVCLLLGMLMFYLASKLKKLSEEEA